jgi:hypothetical protein
MDTREDRIRAKAHDLWEADGRPEGKDRQHWEQAAKLIAEQEREAAKAEVDPDQTQDPLKRSATGDPIGVTLGAMKRQG